VKDFGLWTGSTFCACLCWNISDCAGEGRDARAASCTKPSTQRSVFIFRFASNACPLVDRAGIIFSGYEIAFFALIGTLGLLSLWEFYGMLDYKGLPISK